MKSKPSAAAITAAAVLAALLIAGFAAENYFRRIPPEFKIQKPLAGSSIAKGKISDHDVQGIQPSGPYEVMILILDKESISGVRLSGDLPAFKSQGGFSDHYYYVCRDDGTGGRVVLNHQEPGYVGFTELIPWHGKVLAVFQESPMQQSHFYWIRILDTKTGAISDPVVFNEEYVPYSWKEEGVYIGANVSRPWPKYRQNPFISTLPQEWTDALGIERKKKKPDPPFFGMPKVAGNMLFVTAKSEYFDPKTHYVFHTTDVNFEKLGKPLKARYTGAGGGEDELDFMPGSPVNWHGPVSAKGFLSYVGSYQLAGSDDSLRRGELRVFNPQTAALSKVASIGFRGDEETGYGIALIPPGEPYEPIVDCPVKLFAATEFWQLADGRAIGNIVQNAYAGPTYGYPGFPLFDFDKFDVSYFPYPGGERLEIVKLFDYGGGIVVYGITDGPAPPEGRSASDIPAGPRELWRFDRAGGKWERLGYRDKGLVGLYAESIEVGGADAGGANGESADGAPETVEYLDAEGNVRHKRKLHRWDSVLPLFISHDGKKLCIYDMRGTHGDSRIEIGMIDLTHPDLLYERLDGLPEVSGLTQGVVRIGG